MLAEGKRSFCLVKVHNAKGAVLFNSPRGHGRYLSSTPAGAAKKAGNRFCNARSGKVRADCRLTLVVRECTAGSHKKEFAYKYARKAVKAKVNHGETQVLHRYKSSVKAVKSMDHAKNVKKSVKKSVKRSR